MDSRLDRERRAAERIRSALVLVAGDQVELENGRAVNSVGDRFIAYYVETRDSDRRWLPFGNRAVEPAIQAQQRGRVCSDLKTTGSTHERREEDNDANEQKGTRVEGAIRSTRRRAAHGYPLLYLNWTLPLPNWSDARMGFPFAKSISTTFSLSTPWPCSSCSVATTFLVVRVDHVAGGRERRPAVQAEGDPAGLVANVDAHFCLGGMPSRRRRGACGLCCRRPRFHVRPRSSRCRGWAFRVRVNWRLARRDLDPVQDLASRQIRHFESEQVVDVGEHERLRAVDRERPHDVAEGPDFFGDGVRSARRRPSGVASGDPGWRDMHTSHRQSKWCCGRAGLVDLLDQRAATRRRRHTTRARRMLERTASCRRVRQPFDRSTCRRTFCSQTTLSVARSNAARRRLVLTNSRPLPACAGDAADAFGPRAFRRSPCLDALDEAIVAVHVENKDAGTAMFGLIADAGHAGIEQPLRARWSARGWQTRRRQPMERAAACRRVGIDQRSLAFCAVFSSARAPRRLISTA